MGGQDDDDVEEGFEVGYQVGSTVGLLVLGRKEAERGEEIGGKDELRSSLVERGRRSSSRPRTGQNRFTYHEEVQKLIEE